MVAYVNTSADIKAETDVCCTSANAVQIVERFPKDQKIIFVPDRNLGDYVARQTGREETMILWQGWCHVHDDFRAAEIEADPRRQPGQRAHGPPGEPARGAGDRRRRHQHLGDAAVPGDQRRQDLRRRHGDRAALPARRPLPGQEVHPRVRKAVCPNMKLTTLEKCVATLSDEWDDVLEHEVVVPEQIRIRALQAVERMLA